MQVASPEPTPRASRAIRHATAGASALRGALHAVLNTPVESPLAPLLAVAVGGGAGAGISLLCNGTSRLLGDAVIGGVLGAVSHQFSHDCHLDDAAHRRRWEVLNHSSNMRAWLQQEDIRFVDRAPVEYLHGAMQTSAQGMVEHYRGYCADHGMICDPQAVEAIVRFCIGQCVDRGPFMVLQPHEGRFYLAAIDEESSDALTLDLRAGHPASTLFRRRGYVFMSWELVAATGRTGTPAQQDRPASPACRPTAAPPAPDPTSAPLADCYRPTVHSVVDVRHRRTSNLHQNTARRPQCWWKD